MSRHPPAPETSSALPPIWFGLPSALQQQAVRLLAQLAYAQLRRHAQNFTPEIHHDHSPWQPQDPPRPS
jgi:hypothetical protein